VVVGQPGLTEVPGAFKGVLVKMARDDEKKDVTVKVLPKQRQIEILEEGVVQGK